MNAKKEVEEVFGSVDDFQNSFEGEKICPKCEIRPLDNKGNCPHCDLKNNPKNNLKNKKI